MNELEQLKDKLLMADEFDTEAWVKFWNEIDKTLMESDH